MLPLMIIYYAIVQPAISLFNWVTGRSAAKQQLDEKGADGAAGAKCGKEKKVVEAEDEATQSTQVST